MRVFPKIVVVMAALALAGAGWVAASGEDAKPAQPAEKKPAAEKKADPKCDPEAIEKAKAAAAKAKDGKKVPVPVCKPTDSKESFFTLEDIYAGKLETADRADKADEDDTVTWRKVDDKKKKKSD